MLLFAGGFRSGFRCSGAEVNGDGNAAAGGSVCSWMSSRILAP